MKKWMWVILLTALSVNTLLTSIHIETIREDVQYNKLLTATQFEMHYSWLGNFAQHQETRWEYIISQINNPVSVVMDSVVSIKYYTKDAEYIQQVLEQYPHASEYVDENGLYLGGGSGFVYDELGHIVTCAHVLSLLDEGTPGIYGVVGFANETMRKMLSYSYVSNWGEGTDVGVCSIDSTGLRLKPVKYEAQTKLNVGDPVWIIGCPASYDFAVSKGIVSKLATEYYGSWYVQTDTVVNGGNSGGPVFTALGEFVGIVSWGHSRSGDDSGLNFFVDRDVVIDTATQLIGEM